MGNINKAIFSLTFEVNWKNGVSLEESVYVPSHDVSLKNFLNLNLRGGAAPHQGLNS